MLQSFGNIFFLHKINKNMFSFLLHHEKNIFSEVVINLHREEGLIRHLMEILNLLIKERHQSGKFFGGS